MVHDAKQKKGGTFKRKEIKKNTKCQKLTKPEGILVLQRNSLEKKKNVSSSLKVMILLNVFRAPHNTGVVTF